MIYAATGHRPGKLLGYEKDDQLKSFAVGILEKLLSVERIKPTKLISGMALGWDMAWAEAGKELGIPFDAYIPCKNQSDRWPKSSQERWSYLISWAKNVKSFSDAYTQRCMQDRNEGMVLDCDILVALWDGSKGGTGNCVNFAKTKERKIINCWGDFSRIFLS